MKTYKYLCLLLVCLSVFSCEKEADNENTEEPTPIADSDYTLLVRSPLDLKGVALNGDADGLALDSTESSFAETLYPTLSFRNGQVFSFYTRTGNCSGTLLKFDFQGETSKSVNVFSDLGDCNLTPYAVAHNGDNAYVAYGLVPLDAAPEYFVRVIDLNGGADAFDIPLSKRPVHMEFSNNRLFVLTSDEQANDQNHLTVIDAQTNDILTELVSGSGAQKLFRNTDNTIIIAYDALHTLLDSETFSAKYVNYQEGKEPEIVLADVNTVDGLGRMYYERPAEGLSEYPLVPAVFDFNRNVATLYLFENFLTDNERNFEYKIENTTAVGYDSKNGYLLVGYKKIGLDTGGLLRVREGAEPIVIDAIDLEGIPVHIITQ